MYLFILPWKLAILFVLSVLFHELGHAISIRSFGLEIEGIYFKPFKGCYVDYYEGYAHYESFKISEAGPTFGIINATIYCFFYLVSGNIFWAVIASIILVMTLFNMLPISVLDGGHMMKAIISPWKRSESDDLIGLTKRESLQFSIDYISKVGLCLFLMYIMKGVYTIKVLDQFVFTSLYSKCLKLIIALFL